MKWFIRIPIVILILFIVPELFVMQKLFFLGEGQVIGQTYGMSGVYFAILIGVLFLSLIRSCICVYFYTVLKYYLYEEIHNRKAAYMYMKQTYFFLLGIILFSPITMFILNSYYRTPFVGAATYYLFLVILLHLLASVIVYRRVIYSRITDVIQNFSPLLIFFALLGFVPLGEVLKGILLGFLSGVCFLFLIRFVQTQGLFFDIKKAQIDLETKIYYTKKERAGNFYAKYIEKSHVMTIKQAINYGYFVMNAVYLREKDSALIENKWSKSNVGEHRFIICDLSFYEQMLRFEMDIKDATVIILLPDTEKIENEKQLPDMYDEMVQSYIGRYNEIIIGNILD